MTKRIMVLAGGTGGHVYPALAIACELRASGNEIFWMGTRKGLESRVVPEQGILMDWLSVTGVRGKRGLQLLKAPLLLVWACLQAARILYRRKPDVVIGMGGFVSGPGGFMAWLMGLPLVLHEQNTIPGTTNRILASRANRVLEAFPGSFKPEVGAICTGNPVRAEIVQLREPGSRDAHSGIRILILGGSQGARKLNQIVPKALADLDGRISVFHQSGPTMYEDTVATYCALNVDAKVEPFVEDMTQAYRWADLVICRSGAMTVSELAVAGLASILVPFPYAIDDHQTVNARYLVDAGAGLLLPESESMKEELGNYLRELIADPLRIRSMGQSAQSVARPEAAKRVAEICLGEAA